MAKSKGGRVLAFSYLRFSSPEQEKGDSVRRQTEARDAWLKRHPEVSLDVSLRLEDRGVSAYSSEHWKDPTNALAPFVGLIGTDRVPVGSYLIIENLDRLSRARPASSIQFVLNLIERGLRVVQLFPWEQVYDSEMDQGQLMSMLGELARGHGESKVKSARVGAAWSEKKRKAREGVPHGAAVPAWLLFEGGRYRFRPGAEEAIRLIFRLSREGMGIISLLRALRESRVKPFGTSARWTRSYVAKILRSRAVLGEYQPGKGSSAKVADGEPIPNYFPAVVTEEEWLAAQMAKRSRLGRSGRPPGPNRGKWPFAGLVVNAVDGSRVQVRVRRVGDTLVSGAQQEGQAWACRGSFPLDVFTEAVLGKLVELKGSELFASPTAGRIGELQAQLAAVSRKLSIARARWNDDPESAVWQDAVSAADRELRAVKADLLNAKQEASSPALYAWEDFLGLVQAHEPGRLRAAILATVEEIRMLVVPLSGHKWAAVQVRFRENGAIRTFLVLYRPGRGAGRAHAPRSWQARTLAEVKPEGLDLRQEADVRALQSALLVMDAASF